jgi:hypothetical protein
MQIAFGCFGFVFDEAAARSVVNVIAKRSSSASNSK